MIRLGGFGKIADYNDIKNSGFDYAELDTAEIEGLPDGEFNRFCDKVHLDDFPVSVGARALPIEQEWFFTEHFSLIYYKEYLERACQRSRLLGIEKIILGNGKARRLVEKNSIKKEKRFVDFMRMFAEIAGNYDIKVILEPLGPAYSNYINTLPEAVRLIHEVNMPNFFTMADLRHMFRGGEPLKDIIVYIEYIRHIHVDYPKSCPERRFPRTTDDFDYSEFLDVVKKSGYRGTLTIEADVPGDWKRAYADAAAVLESLRI